MKQSREVLTSLALAIFAASPAYAWPVVGSGLYDPVSALNPVVENSEEHEHEGEEGGSCGLDGCAVHGDSPFPPAPPAAPAPQEDSKASDLDDSLFTPAFTTNPGGNTESPAQQPQDSSQGGASTSQDSETQPWIEPEEIESFSQKMTEAAQEGVKELRRQADSVFSIAAFLAWFREKQTVSQAIVRQMPDHYKFSDSIYQKPLPVIKNYEITTNGPISEMMVSTLCQEQIAAGVRDAQAIKHCQDVVYDKAAVRF